MIRTVQDLIEKLMEFGSDLPVKIEVNGQMRDIEDADTATDEGELVLAIELVWQD